MSHELLTYINNLKSKFQGDGECKNSESCFPLPEIYNLPQSDDAYIVLQGYRSSGGIPSSSTKESGNLSQSKNNCNTNSNCKSINTFVDPLDVVGNNKNKNWSGDDNIKNQKIIDYNNNNKSSKYSIGTYELLSTSNATSNAVNSSFHNLYVKKEEYHNDMFDILNYFNTKINNIDNSNINKRYTYYDGLDIDYYNTYIKKLTNWLYFIVILIYLTVFFMKNLYKSKKEFLYLAIVISMPFLSKTFVQLINKFNNFNVFFDRN